MANSTSAWRRGPVCESQLDICNRNWTSAFADGEWGADVELPSGNPTSATADVQFAQGKLDICAAEMSSCVFATRHLGKSWNTIRRVSQMSKLDICDFATGHPRIADVQLCRNPTSAVRKLNRSDFVVDGGCDSDLSSFPGPTRMAGANRKLDIWFARDDNL
jgi:hypothetical protein